MSTPFLIACKEMEKTNYETISRFVNDTLTDILETRHFKTKFYYLSAMPYRIYIYIYIYN